MIIPLLATAGREWRQLWRDPVGLAVLFAMPAVLVLVLSLVQDNVAKSIGQAPQSFLLVDPDGADLGKRLAESLQAAGVTPVREVQGTRVDADRASALVAAGVYQCAIIVPAGTSAAFDDAIAAAAGKALDATAPAPTATGIDLRFDPLAQGAFRSAVTAQVERALATLEHRARARALAKSLEGRLEPLRAQAGDLLPHLDPAWADNGLVRLTASTGGGLPLPTAAQQNVPAWTIFGMFFIVLPLAGSLLRERQFGTLDRLRTLAVPMPAVVAGKATAFLAVAAIQTLLMTAVGLWLLPALGTDRIDLTAAPGTLALTAALTALAAVAYGLAVGAVARSYEQASTFGALSVVVAAAIGGIMVPLAAMPKPMQTIAVVSPLGWAHQAALAVLVRGEGLRGALPWLTALALFTTTALGVAWAALVHGARRR